jgi:hypothetical protein
LREGREVGEAGKGRVRSVILWRERQRKEKVRGRGMGRNTMIKRNNALGKRRGKGRKRKEGSESGKWGVGSGKKEKKEGK